MGGKNTYFHNRNTYIYIYKFLNFWKTRREDSDKTRLWNEKYSSLQTKLAKLEESNVFLESELIFWKFKFEEKEREYAKEKEYMEGLMNYKKGEKDRNENEEWEKKKIMEAKMRSSLADLKSEKLVK